MNKKCKCGNEIELVLGEIIGTGDLANEKAYYVKEIKNFEVCEKCNLKPKDCGITILLNK